MSNLKIFENNTFGQIRTMENNGQVLFCGSDVAKALGYDQPHKAIERHCKGNGGTFHTVIDSMGREQKAKFINEGNLYRLIMSSKLPEAERFEKWVFEEVLPSIRRDGGYIQGQEQMSGEELMARALQFADNRIKALENERLKLTEKAKEDAPKVLFANAVSASKSTILIGELAKLLKGNGIETGQNRLYEILRNDGYLISRKGTDYNMPTQKAMELGLFKVKETAITHSDGHVSVSKTTKVTGKGQTYFINKYLEKKGNKK